MLVNLDSLSCDELSLKGTLTLVEQFINLDGTVNIQWKRDLSGKIQDAQVQFFSEDSIAPGKSPFQFLSEPFFGVFRGAVPVSIEEQSLKDTRFRIGMLFKFDSSKRNTLEGFLPPTRTIDLWICFAHVSPQNV